MTVTVRDILNRKGSDVVTITADATLQHALNTMVEKKVGALPVLGAQGALVGIITERDLMRAVYQNTPLNPTKVGDIMTRDVVTGTPDNDTEYVMNEMTEGRFRHLPIQENGEIVGIISIGDIVKTQLLQTRNHLYQLIDYVAMPAVE